MFQCKTNIHEQLAILRQLKFKKKMIIFFLRKKLWFYLAQAFSYFKQFWTLGIILPQLTKT